MDAQEFENQGDILQFQIDYGYYTPFGDMKDRFGGNFILNSGFEWQHRSNFTFGLHAGILFGNDVKEDVLTNFRTAEGFILGVDNAIADVVLRERGFRINGSVGHVFALGPALPRSGIKVNLSVGLLQHSIRIQDNTQVVPYVQDDGKKVFDRLTNGLSLSQFIGYQYVSNNGRISLYAGFVFEEAFTKNRRDFDLQTFSKLDKNRNDGLAGFKLGWILPFYINQNPDEIFY